MEAMIIAPCRLRDCSAYAGFSLLTVSRKTHAGIGDLLHRIVQSFEVEAAAVFSGHPVLAVTLNSIANFFQNLRVP